MCEAGMRPGLLAVSQEKIAGGCRFNGPEGRAMTEHIIDDLERLVN